MLENLIDRYKARIDRKALAEKKKVDFIANQFNENKDALKEYMAKENILEETAYNELKYIIEGLSLTLNVTSKNTITKFKNIKNILHVKLGYYKPVCYKHSGEELNPETIIEQCTLTPTEKGKKLFEEYKLIF